jgi:DNA-binding HxlR family transcriptional regulator
MTSSEQTRHLISLLAGRWTLAVLAQLADGGRRYQTSMTHSKVSRTKCSPKPSGEPNATA